MRRIYLIAILVSCVMCGCCSLLKHIEYDKKTDQTLFLSLNNPKPAESKLRTNGIYVRSDVDLKTPTSFMGVEYGGVSGFIFFDYGIFAHVIISSSSDIREQIRYNKKIDTLEKFIDDGTAYISDYSFGVYSIAGDTLNVESYLDYCTFRSLQSSTYVIISSESFKLIERCNIDKERGKRCYNMTDENIAYKFVEATPMISVYEAKFSINKWLWADKKEWKQFKGMFWIYDNMKYYKNPKSAF